MLLKGDFALERNTLRAHTVTFPAVSAVTRHERLVRRGRRNTPVCGGRSERGNMNLNGNKVLRGRGGLVYSMSFILALLLLFAILFLPSGVIAANRASEGASVKVFVGASRSTSLVMGKAYAVMREAALERLAEKDPGGVYSAVMVLDGYYSVEDIEEFAEKEGLGIEGIFLWAPGETGRAWLSVRNNDVEAAVNRARDRAVNLEGTEDYGRAESDIMRILSGKYGIFSVSVKATAEVLNKAKSSGHVGFVDVKYSEEGEKIAAKRGVNVQYIELPYKPDGAL